MDYERNHPKELSRLIVELGVQFASLYPHPEHVPGSLELRQKVELSEHHKAVLVDFEVGVILVLNQQELFLAVPNLELLAFLTHQDCQDEVGEDELPQKREREGETWISFIILHGLQLELNQVNLRQVLHQLPHILPVDCFDRLYIDKESLHLKKFLERDE